ncbi:hypothetical protein AAY473_003098, partial [Plecturocebus cupreus]
MAYRKGGSSFLLCIVMPDIGEGEETTNHTPTPPGQLPCIQGNSQLQAHYIAHPQEFQITFGEIPLYSPSVPDTTQSLTLFLTLECSGMILAYYSLYLLGSSNSCTSASQ